MSSLPFRSSFEGRPDGLLANERGFFDRDPGAVERSPDWEVTSGSLFVRAGAAWTGIPDDADGGRGAVDAASAMWTNSGVFRARTRRTDFHDVTVGANLRIHRFVTAGPTSPAQDWDGVHLFLRYQSPFNLYYASVARRDGRVVIKRKVSGIPAGEASSSSEATANRGRWYEGPPGNSSNHGAYYTIGQSPAGSHRVSVDAWFHVEVSIKAGPVPGTVAIAIGLNGTEVLRATDSAAKYLSDWTGKPSGWPGTTRPITEPGRIGIRADNVELSFNNVTAN